MTEQNQSIGVFLCSCGGTLFNKECSEKIISKISINGTPCKYVFNCASLCTEKSLSFIIESIKKTKINKVVLAACSFIENQNDQNNIKDKIAKSTELTPGAIHIVSIKEQVFFKNDENREKRINQAVIAINKAIKTLLMIPIFQIKKIPITQSVLVIGGGISGIHLAQQIHSYGYNTTLIERKNSIGGKFGLNSDYFYNGIKYQFSKMLKGIEVLTNCFLTELNGNVGAFTAKISTPEGQRSVKYGVIVVASGTTDIGNTVKTSSTNLSLQNNVQLMSFSDLKSIADKIPQKRGVRNIGIILDLYIEETKASTEQALLLAKKLQQKGRLQVYIFCRQMRVASKDLEKLYDDVRESGVNIAKYDGNISFENSNAGTIINYKDSILNKNLTLNCNFIGCSSYGLSVAADSSLAEIVKISRDEFGQLQDNNIHLLPEKTNRPGIFVAGACRGQFYIPQVIEESKATALEIHNLLSKKYLEVELSNAVVDKDKCILCLTCIRSCPSKAMVINRENSTAESIPEVCKRCGVCAAECPARAIELPEYSDKVLAEQILS